jgi:hypothetical protein
MQIIIDRAVLRHFVYGSNLLPARLAARITIARDLGACRVSGWTLRFHKRGGDSSAKAAIVKTGCARDVVYGALVELTPAAAQRLDDYEHGYVRSTVLLDDAGSAFAYTAESGRHAPGLLPFAWYVELILAGANARRLPADWLAVLAAQPVCVDPDTARAAAARALLSAATTR